MTINIEWVALLLNYKIIQLLQISHIIMTLITYCGHGNHCLTINNVFYDRKHDVVCSDLIPYYF